MALLNTGYWQSACWPSNYWQTNPQYWPEYGTATPPAIPAEAVMGKFRKRKLKRGLPRNVLVALKSYLELKMERNT